MMSWKLGLAAATFSLVTVPALAGSAMFDQDFGTAIHPAFAAHVELGAGPENFDQPLSFTAPSSVHALLEGAGRVNVPLGGMWNLETEATARSSWNSDVSSSAVGAYAHLWSMFPSAAFGLFGGGSSGDLSWPFIFGGGSIGPMLSGDTYTAGIEGEAYLNRVTLGGQASITTAQFDNFFPNDHGWQARGYAAYYFDPETKIVGDVKYTDFSAVRFMPAQNRWDVTGLLEHCFAGTSWSMWASGSYSTFSASDDSNAEQWSALVGFRLFLDSPGTSLHRHDREVPFKYDNQIRLLNRPVA